MNLLGIDYGLKKIGLAVAEAGLVTPLKVVKNDSALRAVVEICRQQDIGKIVLGLPTGKMAPAIRRFGTELSLATGLKVNYHDETLTSQEAIAKMVAIGKGRKARKEKQDAFAAALILQNYLECQAKKDV
jgi:putative Holliday junction resolvase